jgi:hypothetical protein
MSTPSVCIARSSIVAALQMRVPPNAPCTAQKLARKLARVYAYRERGQSVGKSADD